MHPTRAFDWTDQTAILEFAAERSFAHIFSTSDAGLFVVHAPVAVTREGRIRFHVARRNRIAPHVEGKAVLISIAGRDGYQSANWYESADQVPTWLYQTAEIEGPARRLDGEELVALLDDLSATFEARYSPERPWTRAKMTPGKFEAMTKAIVGFEVTPAAIRGTRKFNQHKNNADLEATIAGQRGAGREDLVDAINELAGAQ